ncbi:hypothetical protein WN48_11069 [Eufriesea mexicana]|uniref:Uncharacterized protein n=1 Tax=Eufriesea mexicana TaxID=516756 RepID=A0A310SCH9_9HYME|nr:hypothetical protein WN48_11069 [Eufriesea mexicana]
MSRFLRRVLLCGCSSRSGVEGQTFVVDESVVDDGPKSIEFPAIDEQPEDVAMHFDLSTIKFIDDEEPDDDVPLGNGTCVDRETGIRWSRVACKGTIAETGIALEDSAARYPGDSAPAEDHEDAASTMLTIRNRRGSRYCAPLRNLSRNNRLDCEDTSVGTLVVNRSFQVQESFDEILQIPASGNPIRHPVASGHLRYFRGWCPRGISGGEYRRIYQSRHIKETLEDMKHGIVPNEKTSAKDPKTSKGNNDRKERDKQDALGKDGNF